MNFLSLFAGIGGIDLGLERAGMRCVGQVEIDPFCRRVLAKHWPDVPRFEDVRTVTASDFHETIDVIAGGFPCQDISNAGKRVGIDGERSGLWSEFFRLICEVRPRFVLVENVAALLCRGLDRVLGDLASIGFDAEWSVLSACAMGAPHTRERVFVLAYPSGDARERIECRGLEWTPNGDAERHIHEQWSFNQPPRMAHGLPDQLDRNRGLGNTVVPQVAEWIGRRIVAAG